jgi:hypothetical protein
VAVTSLLVALQSDGIPQRNSVWILSFSNLPFVQVPGVRGSNGNQTAWQICLHGGLATGQAILDYFDRAPLKEFYRTAY